MLRVLGLQINRSTHAFHGFSEIARVVERMQRVPAPDFRLVRTLDEAAAHCNIRAILGWPFPYSNATPKELDTVSHSSKTAFLVPLGFGTRDESRDAQEQILRDRIG
jgi:hypothetical protein